jgi:amino acid adenylation domain-containing protein
VTLLHHLLDAAASAHPDRPAVQDERMTVTYGELLRWSGRVAAALMELGVDRGDRVGLYLDKGAAAVAGIYAVLRAGAAYVPLDPAAPAARLGYIAGDCGIRVLLTGTAKAARWEGLIEHGAHLDALVVMDGDDPGSAPEGVRVMGASELRGEGGPVSGGEDDLAYVLYTSGSTGTPKGVMLTHGNALTFVRWAVGRLGVRPDDRLSNHAPLHFDLSVFDLFGAAAGGASVHVVPPEAALLPVEMARFIAERRLTVWYSVPSALTLLATRGGLASGDLPTLRHVVFAGEVFPTKYLQRLMRLVPQAEFHNWYGPTETNVCTAYTVPSDLPEDEPVPIGRAIADTEVFAVTDEGRRATPGAEGELCVRGGGVMKGYWGMPDRTAEVLVPDPLDPKGPGHVYRTGDLVVEGPNGNLWFRGRRDSQIKSRGYRIELGEVEEALLAHPAVMECAVTAVPDELVSNRIRAHVVVQGDLEPADLVRFCGQRLPRYMVPEAIEFREALPRTSTGKIDRRALAET